MSPYARGSSAHLSLPNAIRAFVATQHSGNQLSSLGQVGLVSAWWRAARAAAVRKPAQQVATSNHSCHSFCRGDRLFEGCEIILLVHTDDQSESI